MNAEEYLTTDALIDRINSYLKYLLSVAICTGLTFMPIGKNTGTMTKIAGGL